MIIFNVIPFTINAQLVLSGLLQEHLSIDSNNLKTINFRHEEVVVFNNYLENDSTFELVSPEHLPAGKYVAFYKNDTSKLAIEVMFNQNNNKDGVQKEYFLNGNIKISEHYLNGIRNGTYIKYYKNPEKQIYLYEEYENGLKDGTFIYYCPNGKKISEGNNKEGYNDGIIRRWDCDGNLIDKWRYRNGKIINVSEYKK